MEWRRVSDWPLAALSRQITGPRHRWHVQEQGTGPTVLLLHGAGGSTHSFAGVMRALQGVRMIAVDLPGHGFTQLGGQQRSGLAEMVADFADLCTAQDWAPDLIVAHSAGTPVALALAARMDPQPKVIGINPALGEFEGIAGVIFPALAKLLAALPFTASLFSATASSPARVAELIKSTGSDIPEESKACYRTLVSDRAHVDGALRMMAQWSLAPLWEVADQLRTGIVLITADKDTTVPPKVARDAAKRLPNTQVEELNGYGHLVHEEIPDQIAARILQALNEGKKRALPECRKDPEA